MFPLIGYLSLREKELIDSFKSLTGLVLPSTFLASRGSIFSQEFQCLTRSGPSSVPDSKDLMLIYKRCIGNSLQLLKC